MNSEKISPDVKRELDRQWQIISQGAVDMLPENEFKSKLRRSIETDIPLRIKQGFDPTSPDIHLGHTVGIRKLKQFQDIGHKIVLIVGDYTAMVGDPSGQSATRPSLSYDEILKNSETYQKQFFSILDRSKTEVKYNGEWFKGMTFVEVMTLAAKYTVARLLERDDFSKRVKNEMPISLHELFYPLMQAYDSVAIKADVEIGGTDQTFNLLVGRPIQEAYGVEPQCILTMPILVGLDGEQKMSKSLGNCIGVEDSPNDIFGKIMSIPDKLIYEYFELATDVTVEKLAEVRKTLDDSAINPMNVKKELGVMLVDMYHARGSGLKAKEEFARVFTKKELPSEMPEITLDEIKQLGLDPTKIYLVHLISKSKLAKSNGEARKLIEAGGVSLDDRKITDCNYEFELSTDMVLKVGKRRFLRLKSA